MHPSKVAALGRDVAERLWARNVVWRAFDGVAVPDLESLAWWLDVPSPSELGWAIGAAWLELRGTKKVWAPWKCCDDPRVGSDTELGMVGGQLSRVIVQHCDSCHGEFCPVYFGK